MLSLRNTPLAVQHAETAVAMLDGKIREMVPPEEFPQRQLDEAQRLLDAAKKRATDSVVQPKPGPKSKPGRSLSKADQLALKEAVGLLPQTSAHHGLATPGASRTHSGMVR